MERSAQVKSAKDVVNNPRGSVVHRLTKHIASVPLLSRVNIVLLSGLILLILVSGSAFSNMEFIVSQQTQVTNAVKEVQVRRQLVPLMIQGDIGQQQQDNKQVEELSQSVIAAVRTTNNILGIGLFFATILIGLAIYQINRELKEKQIAQEKLKLEKNKSEAILESIGEGVFAINKEGKIILFNRAAELLSGCSRSEVINKYFGDMLKFYHEKDTTPANDFITDVLSGKKAEMSRYVDLRRKDGIILPMANSATPVLTAGEEIEGVVVVFRDITKERAIKRMRDEFVSIASHELRTPMTAIRGLVSMMFEGDYGTVNDGLKEPLTDIAVSTERLIHLVNDLLNVSRIEAGRMKFTLNDISLKDVIHQVTSSILPLVKQKELTLIADDIPDVTIQVDSEKFQEILNNIIGNAIKFTDKGGITIFARQERDMVKVFIADTGVGISVVDQVQLFGKFQQVNTEKIGRPEGTGLGLYISREIAIEMGGNVWIEHSEEGKGTTFAISVPLAKSAKAATIKQELVRKASMGSEKKII